MAQDLHKTACISCRKRKVKCDRLLRSCSACLKNDVPCRYLSQLPSSTTVDGVAVHHDLRRRKPRGPYKKGKSPREKELEDIEQTMRRRCEYLEKLIQSTSISGSYMGASTIHASKDRPLRHGSTAVGADITFNGGMEYNKINSSDSGERLLGPLPPDIPQSAETHRTRDHSSIERYQKGKEAELLLHPPCEQIFALWHIYVIRVDPITKLVHCPSFAEQLVQGMRSPDTIKSSTHMLMFSIYFASINSLTRNEITERFNEKKETLLAQYMHAMQNTVAYRDALIQPSIETLQALVLHIVCTCRHVDTIHDLSSMTVSLAYQVSRLMGLDRDENVALSPLEVEIGRRCWWTLYRTRLHFIHELGPIFDQAEFEFATASLPLNVNDIDLSCIAEVRPKERTALTDMSYFLLTLELVQLHDKAQKLGSASSSLNAGSSTRCICEELHEHVTKLESKFLKHCDTSRPFDWFVLLTGKAMLTPIEIMVLEHLEGRKHGVEVIASPLSESKDDAKYSLRLDIAECWHMLRTNEKLKCWSWFPWNCQPAVTVDDIRVELAKRPESSQRDRACALISLMSLG